jgi:hypothetical protein
MEETAVLAQLETIRLQRHQAREDAIGAFAQAFSEIPKAL